MAQLQRQHWELLLTDRVPRHPQILCWRWELPSLLVHLRASGRLHPHSSAELTAVEQDPGCSPRSPKRPGPAALRTACPRSLQVTKANSKAGSFSAPALGKEGKGAFSMRNHISKIFSINLQIQGHSLTRFLCKSGIQHPPESSRG